MPWKIALATSETSARVGPRRGDHRGEHLGRGDRRPRVAPGEREELPLDGRHPLDRQLDAEVAAGDHDPAQRRLDDLLGVLGRLRLLDLRDQRDVGAAGPHAALDRLQVLGAADEGDREQVDAVLDREVDPVEVGRGRRPAAATSAPGRLSPWWEATAPPTSTAQRTSSSPRPEHAQADPAVGEVDLSPPSETAVGQAVPGDRQADRRRRSPRPWSGSAPIPGRSPTTPPSTSPIRSFGPGRSPSRPTSLAGPLRRLARHRHVLGVLVAAAVGEVEPEDVGAGPDQLDHRLDRAGRGADRGDDLRPAVARMRRTSVRACDGLGRHRVDLGPVCATGAGVGGRLVRRRRGAASGAGRRRRRLGRRLEPLDVGQPPGGAGEHQPDRDREQARNHWPAESSSRSKNSRTGPAARTSAYSAPRPATSASM